MKNYILKLMNKEKFIITEQDFKEIANASGKVYIKSCDSIINTNMIECSYPENQENQIEETKNQAIGVLHDGTMVEKRFGKWVKYGETTPDDRGNAVPIVIDPENYEEIARDCVPTVKQFEKIKHLPAQERLIIIIKDNALKRLNSEPVKINNLLKK